MLAVIHPVTKISLTTVFVDLRSIPKIVEIDKTVRSCDHQNHHAQLYSAYVVRNMGTLKIIAIEQLDV